MKKILLLAGCLMLIAGAALAQAGYFHVWGDSTRCLCDPDNTDGYMVVHVFHEGTPGATACQFKVEIFGAPLTWVGDQYSFPTVIGSSQNGVAMLYDACLASPIHLMKITYLGISNACDRISIVDDPNATPPGIYVTDCATPDPNLLVAGGTQTYINVDGNCWNCSPYYDPPWCDVPVEETTWGRVKEMYK